MELRHLRCFIAVAEELHFARAAERLHIEQSPLSRAIKELEEELGVMLFARTTRSTRLTRAGELFLEHVRRVLSALEQARDSVKAAANGFHGQLRVALSDGITPSRLSALLVLCRQEEPEVEIRFFEVPLSQQIKGLHSDLYEVGFAQSDEVGDGTYPSKPEPGQRLGTSSMRPLNIVRGRRSQSLPTARCKRSSVRWWETNRNTWPRTLSVQCHAVLSKHWRSS